MELGHMSGRTLRAVLGWIGVNAAAVAASLLLASPAMAQSPTPFGACPIEAYQTIQNGGTYSLYTINVADGSIVNVGSDPDMQGNNGGNTNGINAIGFEETGRFIYGWNNSVRQVVRVGQFGVAEFIGPTPTGMASVNAVVGDVFNQRLYLWNNNGGGTMAIVNLVTNTMESTMATSGVASMNDWAFSATDGNLYYVRNSDGAVVRVNPATGVGTVVPGITVPTGATFGAQYFDSQGSLYASRNDGSIFRIRNATGGGTPSVELLTSAAPPTNQNDGARCPNAPPPVASVSVQKQITAESGSIAGVAEPNELLTYTFTLTNAGTQDQATPYPFFEVLPANTVLVSAGGGSIDCPIGSAGARLCTITVPGPILANGGTATATMVVRVDDPIPVGVTQILNLVTDDANTPPPGCPASNQACSPRAQLQSGDRSEPLRRGAGATVLGRPDRHQDQHLRLRAERPAVGYRGLGQHAELRHRGHQQRARCRQWRGGARSSAHGADLYRCHLQQRHRRRDLRDHAGTDRGQPAIRRGRGAGHLALRWQRAVDADLHRRLIEQACNKKPGLRAGLSLPCGVAPLISVRSAG